MRIRTSKKILLSLSLLFFLNPLRSTLMLIGWRWADDWVVDRFCAGDAEGWAYSTTGKFGRDSDVIDYRERFV